MYVLTQESQFEALKQEHEVLVAYFTTHACDVGEAVLPKVMGLLEEAGVPLVTIDITSLPAVGGQSLVFVAPTLLVFVLGRELDRLSRHFSLSQVQALVERATHIAAEAREA